MESFLDSMESDCKTSRFAGNTAPEAKQNNSIMRVRQDALSKKQFPGSQFSAAGRKRIFLYDGGQNHYSRYAMRGSLMTRFARSFESGGFLNKKQGALWAPCFFDNYPNIFFKSASGVEMGVKPNFSTSTFRIFGDTNAGKLGPM